MIVEPRRVASLTPQTPGVENLFDDLVLPREKLAAIFFCFSSRSTTGSLTSTHSVVVHTHSRGLCEQLTPPSGGGSHPSNITCWVKPPGKRRSILQKETHRNIPTKRKLKRRGRRLTKKPKRGGSRYTKINPKRRDSRYIKKSSVVVVAIQRNGP